MTASSSQLATSWCALVTITLFYIWRVLTYWALFSSSHSACVGEAVPETVPLLSHHHYYSVLSLSQFFVPTAFHLWANPSVSFPVCVFLPMLWVSIAGKVQITGWRGQARRADMPEADKHQLPCLAKTRSTWHTGSIPPVDQPESSLWGLALRCPTHLIPWLTASTFHPSLSFVVNTTHLATEAHTNISFVILSTLLPRFFRFHKLALHTKGKRNHTNTSVCKQKQLSPFSSSPSQSEHRSPTGSDENWLFL